MNGEHSNAPSPVTTDQMNLDPKLKADWIAALRGGEFIQAHGKLCREVDDKIGHCCLGVLAEISGVPREKLFFQPSLDEIGKTNLLGPWYDDGDTNSTTESVQHTLAKMNDEGNNFHAIADWIEANL